jgi:hypothetical protein
MGRALSRVMWIAAGVVVALAVLELVLRFLPVSIGMHRSVDYARWPLQNTEPHLTYTYSSGWAMRNAQRGTTNNYGQVAPFDYRPGRRPVAVIGDSYIESLMNPYDDTLQAQLARRLGARDAVYGFGVSGLSASDYVALARQARDEFAPGAAVILMTDGDLSESLFARVGSYYLTPVADGLRLDYQPVRGNALATRVRRAIGDVSLHRYFQVNLQFSLDPLLQRLQPAAAAGRPHVTAPGPFEDLTAQRKVADWFLAELPASLALRPECIVLLVDTDRYAIYRPELASTRKDAPAVRQYLIERARSLGFRVSDLEPVFRERFARERHKFDHWPIDRHWNRVGYGVGADEAYRLLYQPQGAQAASCAAGKPAWN